MQKGHSSNGSQIPGTTASQPTPPTNPSSTPSEVTQQSTPLKAAPPLPSKKPSLVPRLPAGVKATVPKSPAPKVPAAVKQTAPIEAASPRNDSEAQPLLNSADSPPPMARRPSLFQAQKSPRPSSEALASSSSGITPRTSLLGSSRSPRKDSRPESRMVEIPQAKKVSTGMAENFDLAQAQKNTQEILNRVYYARGLLKDRIKAFIGNKPAVCLKAKAEITAALCDLKELGLNTTPMKDLEALLPKDAPQKPPASPPDFAQQQHLGDSRPTTMKPDSIESSLVSNEATTSTSASSPEKSNTGSGISADNSPEKSKLIPSNRVSSSADGSNNQPSPRTDEDLAAQQQRNISSNLTAAVDTKLDASLPSPIAIVPVCDLFSNNAWQQIAEEANLTPNHALLIPLNNLIFTLKRLMGHFKFEEQGETKELQRVHAPLKQLVEYYNQILEQLVSAKNPIERLAILAIDEAYAFGDSLDFTVIDAAKFPSSGVKARKILCRDELGRTLNAGISTRAICLLDGLAMKANPVGKDYNEPEKEKALSTWYQLHCKTLGKSNHQDQFIAAPTESMKVFHAPVELSSDPKLRPADTLLTHYLHREKMERMVQVGYLLDGNIFRIELQALGAFYNWKNNINKTDLLQHLSQLETVFQQDLLFKQDMKGRPLNERPLCLLDNWPLPLLLHSGLFPPEQMQSHITKKSRELLKYLADDFVQFPRIFHEKIPGYTPEKAYEELPKIYYQFDPYTFDAFFSANLAVDPSDLTPANLITMSTTNDDGTTSRHLGSFDTDNALEYPVTQSVYDNGEVLHFIQTKCTLFTMPWYIDQPFSSQYRAEYLSQKPLDWVLNWCHFQITDDKIKRDQIRQQAITHKDRFEIPEHSEQSELNAATDLMNRKRIAHTEQTSMRVPSTLTPDRLPGMLETEEMQYQAFASDEHLIRKNALRKTRPAVAIYYERALHSKLKSDNPCLSLLDAIHIVSSNVTPSFEELFFGDKITALIKGKMGDKFNPQYMDLMKTYFKLLADQKRADVPPQNPLPSMDTLREECQIPELGGISLKELLKPHRHKKDEHLKNATLSVEAAITLFIEHIEFGKKYYEQGKFLELLHYLNRIGTEHPYIKSVRLTQEQCNHLIGLAAENALPGAMKLLSKVGVDLGTQNANGETPLHTLMRNHRKLDAKRVIDTLEACLVIHTCDPDTLDNEQCTPLMSFIENADPADAKFTDQVIGLFAIHKANLNQRSAFMRKFISQKPAPNVTKEKFFGTVLDFAIDRDKPNAVIALIHEEADLTDTPAALSFTQRYQRDVLQGKKILEAMELLKQLHAPFAYSSAIEQITTTKPDKDHPEHCKIEGELHYTRYLLKSVWDQLFDEKGDIKNQDSVAEGQHIVLPLQREGYNFCLWSALPNKNPQKALANTIYLAENGQYCVRDPNGLVQEGSFLNSLDINFSTLTKQMNQRLKDHATRVEINRASRRLLSELADRGQIHPFLLYCKFSPESPAFQGSVEFLHELMSSPSTSGEFWYCTSPDGKKAFPMRLSNPINGESLYTVLCSKEKTQKLYAKLDREKFDLSCTVEKWVVHEDAHADQFKVVNIKTRKGEKFRIINVDNERTWLPAFKYDEKGRVLLFKDVQFLLAPFSQPMNTQAVSTIIRANGKKLPPKALDWDGVEAHLHANAEQLVDALRDRCLLLDRREQEMCPRGDALSESVTQTATQMREKEKFLTKTIGNLLDNLEKPEQAQAQKTMSKDEKKNAQSFGEKMLGKANAKLGRNKDITTLGSYQAREMLAKLRINICTSQKILYRNSSRPFSNMMFLKELRREIYYRYSPFAKPGIHPLIGFKGVTAEQTEKKSNAFEVSKTVNKHQEVVFYVTQCPSTKFLAVESCDSFQDCVEFYESDKRRAKLKALARREIKKGDTTLFQACKTDEERQDLLKGMIWTPKSIDNQSVLDTIIDQVKHHNLRPKHLSLNGCDVATWDDLVTLLKYSPELKTLDLTQCSGLNNLLNLKRNLFRLFQDYTPNLQSVKFSRTEISWFEYDGSLLPSLTLIEARNCLLCKTAKFKDSRLEVLDLSYSNQIASAPFIYSPEQALLRPLEEERPLKELHILGCEALKADDIENILVCSPFLRTLSHENNQPFKARVYVTYALMQDRFTKNTFEAMFQHGVLTLPKLIEDHHLQQIFEWLTADKKAKVTEVNFLGCTLLSRGAKSKFVFGLSVLPNTDRVKVFEPGPLRDNRSQGHPYEWDTGLTTPISAWEELPTGDIFVIGQHKAGRGRNGNGIEYSFRSSDRTNKQDYKAFGSGSDSRDDKFKGKVQLLKNAVTIISSAQMADGTTLLSTCDDTKYDSSAQLVMLDTITDQSMILDVSEVTNFGGQLCALSHNTFALHSDQFYIIRKGEHRWEVLHKVKGALGLTPIIKGPDNLVAFCSIEDSRARLCVMDTKSGVLVYNRLYKTDLVKALYFMGNERLIICDGDLSRETIVGERKITITEYSMVILNIKTHEIKVFKADLELNTERLKNHAAIATPSNEILVTRVGLLDNHQLTENAKYPDANGSGRPIVCYQGDVLTLRENPQSKGYLIMSRNRHHIIELSCPKKNQQDYQITLLNDGEYFTLKLTAPHKIERSGLDIDLSSIDAWCLKQSSGQPTGKSLFDLVSAFFEKDSIGDEKNSDKQCVTCKDNIITIKGLSEKEAHDLQSSLKSFWHQPASPLMDRNRLSLNIAQPTTKPSPTRRTSQCELIDDETEESISLVN
jgi:hypothetical protein